MIVVRDVPPGRMRTGKRHGTSRNIIYNALRRIFSILPLAA